VSTLEALLQSGADLHARDKNGVPPLHRAERARCAAATNFLLAGGFDANLRSKRGSTAFHLAVQNTAHSGSGSDAPKAAQREIIQALLAHGVSPATRDGSGRSVLDWAKSDWIRQWLTGRSPRTSTFRRLSPLTSQTPLHDTPHEQRSRPRRHQKGAFILTTDGTRQNWQITGPHFAGWQMYHLKGSSVWSAHRPHRS
jgi:hypothetical protein